MLSREDFRVFLGLARIEFLVSTRGGIISFIVFSAISFVFTLVLSLDWNVFSDNVKEVNKARSEIFSHDFKNKEASEVYLTWSAKSNEMHVNRPKKSLIDMFLEYRSKTLKITEPYKFQKTSSFSENLFLTDKYNLPAWSLGYQGNKDSDQAFKQIIKSTRFTSWIYVAPGAEEAFFKSAGPHYGSAIFIIPDDVSSQSLRVHLYEPKDQDSDNIKLIESAVSRILDERAQMIFHQKIKDLGLTSGTFNSPSVKVIAKDSVKDITKIAADQVILNDAETKKYQIIVTSFVFWMFAIDIGSICGPIYLSVWIKRQTEGGFEMYAKSPQSAWSMCAAQPAAVAILHWCPLAIGTALGWIVAFRFGHGSTMVSLLNVILGILVIGCSALMSVFITLASLSLSSHPIFRSWIGIFQALSIVAINSGGIWDFSGEIFAQAMNNFSTENAFKTIFFMLLISIISLSIAHVKTGRFCRIIWQNRPKN